MWRGYEHALCTYATAICDEWITRGYKDAQRAWFEQQLRELLRTGDPPWLGEPAFHASHRSNLLRKDPEWYGQFGWQEASTLPYVWPEAA
jgi:hypothetical protein